MSETYNCENCQTKDFFESWEAMKKHLVEVHKVDLKTAKVNREMTMHIDGRDYFASNYRITVLVDPPVVLTCTVKSMRRKNDPMMFYE